MLDPPLRPQHLYDTVAHIFNCEALSGLNCIHINNKVHNRSKGLNISYFTPYKHMCKDNKSKAAFRARPARPGLAAARSPGCCSPASSGSGPSRRSRHDRFSQQGRRGPWPPEGDSGGGGRPGLGRSWCRAGQGRGRAPPARGPPTWSGSPGVDGGPAGPRGAVPLPAGPRSGSAAAHTARPPPCRHCMEWETQLPCQQVPGPGQAAPVRRADRLPAPSPLSHVALGVRWFFDRDLNCNNCNIMKTCQNCNKFQRFTVKT